MKLLNRTIRNYLIYSISLVLLFTPLFYYSIQHLVVREMDKVLISHKKDFNESLVHLKSKEELEFFPLMNKEFILTPASELVKDSIYSEKVYDSITKQGVPHRVYRSGLVLQGKNYELIIRESLVSNMALIGSIMGIQLLMLALMLAGLFLINRNLSKIVWTPFYLILDRLKKFNIDRDNEIEFPTSSTVELRELTIAVDELIKKNRAVYQNQKEFTENASHELQTPLAICRTKLELLAQTKELTQEQAELVESLLQATDRISRLNRNLLLLSKIENRQFPDHEEINLNDIIEKVRALYAPQATEKKVKVNYSPVGTTTITGNSSLVEILVNNLWSNAVRHAPHDSTIHVDLCENALTISNSGEQLRKPEKIFERFQRENTLATSGSGLGLSIVKKICEVSSYRVSYFFNDDRHHFKIEF
jgi:signal transduction histidine kinase